eukprot:COSAG01_NODE_76275_length_187_cov_251.056818_1_plen_56_part_01
MSSVVKYQRHQRDCQKPNRHAYFLGVVGSWKLRTAFRTRLPSALQQGALHQGPTPP